jgi:hypothetical protein
MLRLFIQLYVVNAPTGSDAQLSHQPHHHAGEQLLSWGCDLLLVLFYYLLRYGPLLLNSLFEVCIYFLCRVLYLHQ